VNQLAALSQIGIVAVQFPDKGGALLIAQGQNLLPGVKGEAHKPNLAHFVIKMMKYRGGRLLGFDLVPRGRKFSRLPAHNGVLAGFREDKVPKPLNAIHIVTVYIPRRKVRKVLFDGGERSRVFVGAKSRAQLDGLFYVRLIQAPQFQRVIHSTRHDAVTSQIEVHGQHFIAMSFDASKNSNTYVRLDVPQPQRVILTA